MKIDIGNREIEADVADSVLKRSLGLSFRTEGKMLFKFPRDTRAPIDMMLMRKRLYLYFMNSEKKVIHVEVAEPWYRMPKKLFHRPESSYKFVLESFEELDVEEGDCLEFFE
jgi:uncharacterized membrane protein (UPF0127 family)